ncbi:MAG: hypothetical protein RIT81_32165 [Deltaproteobacteria bacterium]
MLDLTNVEGSVHLKCEVVGYESPEEARDDWCTVSVDVRQNEHRFMKRDPALEATDLARIRQWFRCLADDRLPPSAHLGFTEPCIRFQFLARGHDTVRFAIHLDHELRPSFPLEQFESNSNDWIVVFRATFSELSDLADAVGRAALKFPARSS